MDHAPNAPAKINAFGDCRPSSTAGFSASSRAASTRGDSRESDRFPQSSLFRNFSFNFLPNDSEVRRGGRLRTASHYDRTANTVYPRRSWGFFRPLLTTRLFLFLGRPQHSPGDGRWRYFSGPCLLVQEMQVISFAPFSLSQTFHAPSSSTNVGGEFSTRKCFRPGKVPRWERIARSCS